jgi:hypothetical protein
MLATLAHRPRIVTMGESKQPRPRFSPIRASLGNRSELERSTRCACYCCRKFFAYTQITEWAEGDDGTTAVCPLCNVDAVIGDAQYPNMSDADLERWHKIGFSSA